MNVVIVSDRKVAKDLARATWVPLREVLRQALPASG
jgi:hypothetical protein